MSKKKNARKNVKPVESDAWEDAPATSNSTATTTRSQSRYVRFLRSRYALQLFWFLALWYFWGVRYGDFLFAVQENSLFITRWDFFHEWLTEPAGALGYATALLIQLGRYPLLGGAALAGLGVALAINTARFLRLKGLALHLAIVPTLALAVSGTWHAYYVYNSANVTLVFSGYVGANLALLFSLGLRALERRRRQRRTFNGASYYLTTTLVAVLFLHFGYLLFGVWAALSLALFAIDELLTRGVERGRATRACVLLAVAGAAPYALFSTFFYDKAPRDAVWILGLFDPTIDKSDPTARAFVVGGASFAFFFWLVGVAFVAVIARVHTHATEATSDEPRSNAKLSVAATVAFVITLWTLAYHDESFFAILAQNRALTRGDWDAVLKIDERVERPIDYGVALRNVALFEQGELGERAFERPVAGLATTPFDSETFEKIKARDPDALKKLERFQKRRVTQRGALNSTPEIILCRYGLPNDATRNAMNKRALCRGRSAATLKLLAYCALIGGERDLAERYARELDDAVNQRYFAKLCRAYMATDAFDAGLRDVVNDKTYDEARYPSGAKLPKPGEKLDEVAHRCRVDRDELERFALSISRARRMRPQKNFKRVVFQPDLARLYGLFTDPFDVAVHEIREAELVAALFQKGDFNTPGDRFFMTNIESYINENAPNGRLPKALEQGYATLRFEDLGKDWTNANYQFSEETKRAFGEYVEFYDLINGATQLREAQDGIRRHCAGSYWGYLKDESSFIRF